MEEIDILRKENYKLKKELLEYKQKKYDTEIFNEKSVVELGVLLRKMLRKEELK